MVSLWPWKGDDTSPASFEKALSSLSARITKSTTRLDDLRKRSRRLKALWTLYSVFAYLLCFIILALVVGWKNWTAVEYTAVAGGPVIIYLIRLGLTTYYDYRTSKLQAHVDVLQKQRDTTIDKLKAATKYNTTQQLLEKYGGTPSKAKTGNSDRKTTPSQANSSTLKGGRTGFVPPPTANIPGRNVMASLPNTPLRSTSASSPIGLPPPLTAAAASPPWQQPSSPVETAEFAPNAFSSVPQYEQVASGPRWYDRLMDVLLGEDEANPKNRLALICMKCRLVNGQAPPGVKQLEDVGKWRCSGCGAMNGVESEGKRILKEFQQRSASEEEKTFDRQDQGVKLSPDEDDHEAVPVDHGLDDESDVTQYSEDETDELLGEDKPLKAAEEPETVKPKRGRPKGSGKKKA